MAQGKKLAVAGALVRAWFTAGPNAAVLTLPNSSVFIADADYEVVEACEVHETLGADGAAVTADVVKCTGTQTAAQGASVLAAAFDLKATINTVVRKTASSGLSATAANKRITKGDRIAIKFTGTLTSVTGLCIQVTLKQRTAGHQPNY